MAKFPPINQATDIPQATLGGASGALDTSSGFEKLGAGLVTFGEAMQKRAEQDDITNIDVKLEQKKLEKANAYSQAAQQGLTDEAFNQKFSEDLDKDLSEIGDSASTRAGSLYFSRNSQNIKSSFAIQQAHAQAALAGEKAVSKFKSRLEATSGFVFSNPGEIRNSLSEFNNYVDELVRTGLDAKVAIKLKQEGENTIQYSSALGWSKLEPEQLRDEVLSGTFDSILSAKQKDSLLTEAWTEIQYRKTNEAYLKKQQKEVLNEQREAVEQSFVDKLLKKQLTPKEINDDPYLSADKKIVWLKRIGEVSSSGTGFVKNPSVYTSLYNRIMLPDGNPNKIYESSQLTPYLNRGLDPAWLNSLNGYLTQSKTTEGKAINELRNKFLKSVQTKLGYSDDIALMKDPKAAELYTNFLADLQQEELSARKSGVPQRDLYIESSPNYLGKLVPSRKMSEILRERSGAYKQNKDGTPISPSKNVPPRKPGQSYSDWLKERRGEK